MSRSRPVGAGLDHLRERRQTDGTRASRRGNRRQAMDQFDGWRSARSQNRDFSAPANEAPWNAILTQPGPWRQGFQPFRSWAASANKLTGLGQQRLGDLAVQVGVAAGFIVESIENAKFVGPSFMAYQEVVPVSFMARGCADFRNTSSSCSLPALAWSDGEQCESIQETSFDSRCLRCGSGHRGLQ